jgi:hypothetical protein
VTAKSINIQGGSINVQTTSQTTDVIRLNHNEWTMEVSPLQVKVTNSTIGGHILIQAGAIMGYWNDQLKFAITSDYGNVQLYGLNGVRAIGLFPNQNTVSVCDSSGNQTILLDGNTGNVYAANFVQT